PLQKGEPGTDVFGSPVPGLPGPEFGVELYEGLERRENMVVALEDGLFERAFKDGVFHLRVRPHKDSDISVEVSSDGLSAYLSFSHSAGAGKEMTMARVN